MARITRPELLATLVKADIPFYQLNVPGGGTAVVTQRGARILGLFPGEGDDVANALWTHDRIVDFGTGVLRDWIDAGMGSLGGERLWVSPERTYYYFRPATFEQWFCPKAMDPGEYERVDDPDGEVAYKNTFDLENMETADSYENVCMTRRFQPLENPYAADAALAPVLERLGYSGVRKIDSLELPEAPAETRVNLWTLALIDPRPPGVGTIVVPVRPGAKPADYFGGLTGERLVRRDDHVAFKIDAMSIGKVGIRPEDIDLEHGAQIAAFLPSTADDRLLLVVQRSADVPRSQDECLDVAKADPDGPKGVVQSYNNGPGDDPGAPYAQFGEAELQLAAARPTPDGKGLAARATSDLMAFEGAKEGVLTLGKSVLGIGDIQLF